MIVVADTSAVLAAFSQETTEHAAAVLIMEQETLLLSPMVLTELDHLVERDLGYRAAHEVLEALLIRLEAGRYALAEVTNADLRTAQSVRLQYKDLRLDLADALGVALADKHRTDRIFTLDHRDFRAITPLTPKFGAFRLYPADM